MLVATLLIAPVAIGALFLFGAHVDSRTGRIVRKSWRELMEAVVHCARVRNVGVINLFSGFAAIAFVQPWLASLAT